jgi:hypothetical protein
MSCQTLNGISSNQVLEVGLLKPRCATFEGNTLNDWLKWLSEKECEIDWSALDLTCIEGVKVKCEQNQKYVIETIINALCKAQDCCKETIGFITVDNRWNPLRTPRYNLTGNKVTITGAVQGMTFDIDFATLPLEARPTTQLIVPIAHEFPPSATYNVFVRINTNGTMRLFFTGVAPSNGTNRNVYLDGLSFFKN